MLQWRPRFNALAAVVVLIAVALALGYFDQPLDLFW